MRSNDRLRENKNIVLFRIFFGSTLKLEFFSLNLRNKSSKMSVHNVSNRYKCTNLLDNLNIGCTPSNLIIMWNKYQIFIYEGSLESPTKIFAPEYRVHRLLVTKDHVLCLDTNGYVHVTDFTKNVDQILPHAPQAQGIKACVIYTQDECLSLKYDSDSYYLCVNRIHSDYQDLNKVKLSAKGPWPLQDGAKDKYILTHKKIDEHCLRVFQKLFKTESLTTNAHFIAISFDNHTVYGCPCDMNKNEDKTNLVKIFSCPSEICSIDIVGTENIYLVIGLKMGTVIQLTLHDLNNCLDSFPTGLRTEAIHLNSALHKIVVSNDTFIYTDGATMWRANNVYSKDITFKQFFVKNVNDFILHGNNIICTTFTKIIYTFSLDTDESYLKSENKDYNTAIDVLKNSDYLNKIFQEVEKSKELAKQLSIEGSYIAAMSLSKRQEIMDKAITVSVTVCGCFEEVLQEINEEVTVPEDLSKYMEASVHLLLVKVKIEKEAQGGLYDIVTDILANSETVIHVSLSNDTKIFKTASIKINKMNFLIPHYTETENEINVNIRIVARVPGTYNKNQKIWTELYRKDIKVTAENFIQPTYHKSHLLSCVKEWTQDFDSSIILCTNMQRKEFYYVNATTPNTSYVVYLRLPRALKYSDFAKHLSKMKSKFLFDLFSRDDFLKSKITIEFLVGIRDAVEMTIENDGFSVPCLKLVGNSIKVISSLRVFFSDIVYGDYDCKPGEEFIKLSFYTAVENLKKDTKECIENSASYNEFAPLMDKFERIIGLIPI